MYFSLNYQMLCTVLISSLMVQFVAACEARHTKEPLYEYRCVCQVLKWLFPGLIVLSASGNV